MNNDVGLQLYGGALFFALGLLFGVVQCTILGFYHKTKHTIIYNILQFVAVSAYGCGFIATTHFLFKGYITYYTIFSVLLGFITGIYACKKPIFTLCNKIKILHNARVSAHNNSNDKGEKCQTKTTNIDSINSKHKNKKLLKIMKSKQHPVCKS